MADAYPLLKDNLYVQTSGRCSSETCVLEEEVIQSESYRKNFRTGGNGRRFSLSICVIHIFILLLYSIILTLLFTRHKGSPKTEIERLYSPVAESMRYVTKVVDGRVTDSIFGERPNPKGDEAWADLMVGINMRVTHEEKVLLNNADPTWEDSLEMADGSGYLGTLGVYHELHCIKRLRKWFNHDYYYGNSNETAHDILERTTHAEHCLELLRQAAICHADISVTSYRWLRDDGGAILEPTTQDGTLHKCADWSVISDFARSRAVDLFDPNLLVRTGRVEEVKSKEQDAQPM